MSTPNMLSPREIRNMKDLKRLGNPQNPPTWLNSGFVAYCMMEPRTQTGWSPLAGDWYYCSRLGVVRKMESIRTLKSQHSSLESNAQLGSVLSGGCDVYLPNPEALEKLRLTPL